VGSGRGMFDEARRFMAARRLKPGDGRPLKPFRWWQVLSRALFTLQLTGPEGETTIYAVSINHWGDKTTGEVEAHLYRDGHQQAVSRMPAVFPVEGGTIEVAVSAFGLKRCHYVTEEGTQQQLTPDPRSGEGRRARFDREQPGLSRTLGGLSLAVLVIGLLILIPQLVETLSAIPPIAENLGTFTSPITLSTWGNVAVTAVTVVASTERALRLRYNALLDGSVG
jgi:hypothetical protein